MGDVSPTISYMALAPLVPVALEVPLKQAGVGASGVYAEGVESCLGFWALYLPGVHPLVEWFAVAVNHLRSPTNLDPQHSHEIVVVSIDPDTYLDSVAWSFNPYDLRTYKALPPPELEFKFGKTSDGAARALAQRLVDLLIAGAFKPEPESLRAWRAALPPYTSEIRS